MKRLLWMLVLISGDLVGIRYNNAKKNTQLCLNTTPDFGTRHFIVGYKEKVAPMAVETETAAIAIKEKKTSQRTSHKKQKDIRGGAELIDKNCKMQSFFTSIHDLSDILVSVITEAKKKLCIAEFTLTDHRIEVFVI